MEQEIYSEDLKTLSKEVESMDGDFAKALEMASDTGTIGNTSSCDGDKTCKP